MYYKKPNILVKPDFTVGDVVYIDIGLEIPAVRIVSEMNLVDGKIHFALYNERMNETEWFVYEEHMKNTIKTEAKV